MRPQDIAIVLKIVASKGNVTQLVPLANSLNLSLSEISESLNRSMIAGLIDFDKKKVNRQHLSEFLEHGIKYVFPQQPGSLVRGIPTAHSHPDFEKKFISEMKYVWPDVHGKVLGLQIDPLYKKQVDAVKNDPLFYRLLALVDMIRVGRTREVKFAIEKLSSEIDQHEPRS